MASNYQIIIDESNISTACYTPSDFVTFTSFGIEKRNPEDLSVIKEVTKSGPTNDCFADSDNNLYGYNRHSIPSKLYKLNSDWPTVRENFLGKDTDVASFSVCPIKDFSHIAVYDARFCSTEIELMGDDKYRYHVSLGSVVDWTVDRRETYQDVDIGEIVLDQNYIYTVVYTDKSKYLTVRDYDFNVVNEVLLPQDLGVKGMNVRHGEVLLFTNKKVAVVSGLPSNPQVQIVADYSESHRYGDVIKFAMLLDNHRVLIEIYDGVTIN
jgi:hypothetical protein